MGETKTDEAPVTVVVSIQTLRSGQNHDVYLRGTCEDMTIASVTETVRAMLKNQKDHEIGKSYSTRPGRKPKKTAPVKRPDDESAEPQELQA
jgi:hypothetical protein